MRRCNCDIYKPAESESITVLVVERREERDSSATFFLEEISSSSAFFLFVVSASNFSFNSFSSSKADASDCVDFFLPVIFARIYQPKAPKLVSPWQARMLIR
eukprot:Pompholyxophrys_punicea_v1_NODE_27_length_5184_cov_24.170599.p3 type:complete len:102 gc:universal NODE_27_length_5184_cov_24.170599:2091-1786(-)